MGEDVKKLTRTEMMEKLRRFYDNCIAIVERKNQDYAGESDPFRNLELVEKVGICSTEEGIAVRLCDKLSRTATLLNSPAAVADDPLVDSLMDSCNYNAFIAIHKELL